MQQTSSTDSAMVQTAQSYRAMKTDSAMVQTAQLYRRRTGTDGAMIQTAQWSTQHTEAGSRCAGGFCLCHICRGLKADLEHDIQGVWILYFHCYNGATVLQLGLVHLQGTCSLLDTHCIILQTSNAKLVIVLQKRYVVGLLQMKVQHTARLAGSL